MKKHVKSLIALLVAIAVICSAIPNAEPIRAQAEEAAATVGYQEFTSGTIVGGVAPADTEGITIDEQYQTGYVFGGWYKAADETTPLSNGEEVTASEETPVYAKWVPEEVMSVKTQYHQDTETDEQVVSVQYFDCDTSTANGNPITYLATNLSNTLATTEDIYKEGTGALQCVGKASERFTIKRSEATALDASACDGGALSFWLHVKEDPSDLNTVLVIELGSGTGNSDACYIWRYDTEKLTTGWNKMLLDFRTCSSVAGTVDMSKLRYFNMWRQTDVDLTLTMDDIRIVKTEGMLFNCDNMYDDETHSAEFTSSVTNVDGEYMEGIGAYKVVGTGSKTLWYELTKATPIDLTDYETGSLHFWLYVSDPSNLAGALVVNIGNDASNCYRFNLAKDNLIAGWNECEFEFANKNSTTGTVDITKVDTFRMWRALSDTSQEMTMILDDVRVVKRSEGMLLDCNETTGVTGSGITVTNAHTVDLKEYQEGNGAYKHPASTTQVRHEVKLTTGLDVAQDGDTSACKYTSLRFWLYIDNINNLNNGLRIEIASDNTSADHDKYEIQWPVMNDYLVSGWNELYLNLDRAQNSDGYAVDFSNICYFRIYTGSALTSSLITILDDVEFVSAGQDTTELRFVSTVDSDSYKSAGFRITLTDVNGAKKGKTAETSSDVVYPKLYGISNKKEILTYEPTSFHAESDYFYAIVFDQAMPSQIFDSVLTVTPYWVTPDGTEVTGVVRTYTINYILNGILNLDNH